MTSDKTNTSWLMAATLILMGTSIALVFFFVIELALRIMYPEVVLAIEEERRRVENLAYVFHPEYLVSLKPSIKKTFPADRDNGVEFIPWQTNTDAFRGKALRKHPLARIIVYGDSNIEAPFSHLENTYPNKLEQYLTEPSGADIEVINGGIDGSGPDQSLMRFAAQFDKYKPSLIVFHVFADNDFGDIVRNRIFALNSQNELVPTGFRATVDDAFKSKLSRLLLVVAAQEIRRYYTEPVDDALEALPSQLVIIEKLLKKTQAEYAIYKKGGRRVFSHFDDHYDIDIALAPTAESSRVKIALMEGVLRKVKWTAEEKGTKLLVLIQPSIIDVTHGNARWAALPTGHGDALTSTFLSRFHEYRKDRLTSVIDEICARNEIDRINLFPIFTRNDPDSLYFKSGDSHWNDAGQDLAARETANYIQVSLPRLGR